MLGWTPLADEATADEYQFLLAIVTGGGSGMIVNDGIAVEMAPMEVEALLADVPIVAEL